MCYAALARVGRESLSSSRNSWPFPDDVHLEGQDSDSCLIRILKRGIVHATLTKAKQPVSYDIGTA